MRSIKARFFVNTLIAVILFSGCGGGGGDSSSTPGTGTLSLSLTDASTTEYRAVYVTIDKVLVHKDGASSGNSGWFTVATPGQTYNLIKLVNGLTAILGESELEADRYRQIRLMIGREPESATNILGVPHPHANYVILNDGADTVKELKIPSGFRSGLKLVHRFQVPAGTVVELVLDFDACRSVVRTGSGRYRLKPRIKVIDVKDKSIVYGVVTDSGTELPVTGALVSAQLSEGLSASVVRSTLTSDDAGEEGRFSLLLSPGQEYQIVAYADQKVVGSDGSEAMYAPACGWITVPDHGPARVYVSLVQTGFGTISGDVSLNGAIDPDNPPVVNIQFYRMLDCGYVEITSLPMSPDTESQTLAFSVDLPLGTYDVVASSDGLTPGTAPSVELSASGDDVHVELSL